MNAFFQCLFVLKLDYITFAGVGGEESFKHEAKTANKHDLSTIK